MIFFSQWQIVLSICLLLLSNNIPWYPAYMLDIKGMHMLSSKSDLIEGLGPEYAEDILSRSLKKTPHHSIKGVFFPGFILKLMKKFVRWRCCWNIWLLNLKTKIYLLLVRYQEFNEYQKNQLDLRNSDLEICCANTQPKLKNWKSVILMVFGGFLKFIQYLLLISKLTQQIYL